MLKQIQINSALISLKFIGMLLFLTYSIICYGADNLSEAKANRLPNNSGQVIDGIILHPDQSGHFRGKLSINNTELPFIIDTGATVTVIPMKFALDARLPFGRQVDISTAGGRTFDKLTTIDSLKIGNAEIKNIEAVLNQHLTEILVGMNTLKFFKMTQSGDTLTLQLDSDLIKKNRLEGQVNTVKDSQTAQDISRQSKDYISNNPITRTVICDDDNHCITKFGN